MHFAHARAVFRPPRREATCAMARMLVLGSPLIQADAPVQSPCHPGRRVEEEARKQWMAYYVACGRHDDARLLGWMGEEVEWPPPSSRKRAARMQAAAQAAHQAAAPTVRQEDFGRKAERRIRRSVGFADTTLDGVTGRDLA